jgi:hypothetical protein
MTAGSWKMTMRLILIGILRHIVYTESAAQTFTIKSVGIGIAYAINSSATS